MSNEGYKLELQTAAGDYLFTSEADLNYLINLLGSLDDDEYLEADNDVWIRVGSIIAVTNA